MSNQDVSLFSTRASSGRTPLGCVWAVSRSGFQCAGPRRALPPLSSRCRCLCSCASVFYFFFSFTSVFTAFPPPYKSILQKLPLHHQWGVGRKGFLWASVPVGYLPCTGIVTTALSLQEKKTEISELFPRRTKYWSGVYCTPPPKSPRNLCSVLCFKRRRVKRGSNKAAKKGVEMKNGSNVCITFTRKPTCSNENIKVQASYCSL